jgi:hypothetical protein
VDPARFEGMAFEHFFLQPMDGPLRADNTARAIRDCQQHPRWRLGRAVAQDDWNPMSYEISQRFFF